MNLADDLMATLCIADNNLKGGRPYSHLETFQPRIHKDDKQRWGSAFRHRVDCLKFRFFGSEF